MDDELTPELREERDALIQVIEAAFGSVTRQDGVSWTETRVLDDRGTDQEREWARAQDREESWQALVDDEDWDPETGIGGWSFLDSNGFRYYLPAALVRSLRAGYDVGIRFHLTLPKRFLRDHALKQWSALDPGQRSAIARFLRFMIAMETSFGDEIYLEGWRSAYQSYWSSLTQLEA